MLTGTLWMLSGEQGQEPGDQVGEDCIVPCKRDSGGWIRVVTEQVMDVAEF